MVFAEESPNRDTTAYELINFYTGMLEITDQGRLQPLYSLKPELLKEYTISEEKLAAALS